MDPMVDTLDSSRRVAWAKYYEVEAEARAWKEAFASAVTIMAAWAVDPGGFDSGFIAKRLAWLEDRLSVDVAELMNSKGELSPMWRAHREAMRVNGGVCPFHDAEGCHALDRLKADESPSR